jgi:hypothetical protein
MVGGVAAGAAGAFVCAPTDATNPNINPHPNDALTTTRMHTLSCFQLRFSFQGLFGFYSLHPRNFCDNPRMRFRRAITHPAVPGPGIAAATLFLGTLAMAALLACSPLSAQVQSSQPTQQSTPQEGSAYTLGPAYTLHLSTRVVQIPAIVNPTNGHEIPEIAAQQFNIKLNSGPTFHPDRVRREGDDPITLAILLDVSGDQSHMLPDFSKGLNNWITTSFKPQDHISIYALDCGIIRTDSYEPPNPALLQQGFDAALNASAIHGTKTRAACGNSLHLWDAIKYVMDQLSQLPGRRVLFVASNGYDGGSKLDPNAVSIAATSDAVTVFGVSLVSSLAPPSSEVWLSFCNSTGGIAFGDAADFLPKVLTHFIDVLRKRYILEFTMNDDPKAGRYIVTVTAPKIAATIQTSGLGVPLPDPNPGPNELPSAVPATPPTHTPNR